MIKTFAELSAGSKARLYTFISSPKVFNSFESQQEMEQLYSGEVLENGLGHFSLWEGERVVGAIAVIKKEVMTRNEIFMNGIRIAECEAGKFQALLSRALDYCSDCKGASIKPGLSYNHIFLRSCLEENGFSEVYRLLSMRFNGRKDVEPQLAEGGHFEALSENNAKAFQKIHNLAFLTSRNGSVMEDDELAELLEECKGNKASAGLYYSGSRPSGIYMLKIKDEIGWIEAIGVHPELWGGGIGRKLLLKSVKELGAMGAGTIKLTVISSNVNAVKLYTDCGFIEEKVESYWFGRQV